VKVYSKTDIGLVRHSNQDAVSTVILEDGSVFAVVCDGMGGANAGNIASEMASKTISDYVKSSYNFNMDSIDIEKMLKNAIVSANMEIYDMSLKDNELKGMGTTVVSAFVKNSQAVIAHVGDSRAYIAGNELNQVTKDHSVVQSLIESGKLTPEAAKVHPRKNVITRALGTEENVVVDTNEFSLDNTDVLLLCTDGLSGYVRESEILKVLKKETENSPERLIELAKKSGGGDNITVVTIEVGKEH
jgi:protein phosphatase